MRYLVVDIETCGLPEAKDWLDPLQAPANYKKPESIEAYLKEAEVERLGKLALDPDCNRIVAIGWVDAAGGDPTVRLASDPAAERESLRAFWTAYTQHHDTRLVTFNGLRFDLPVLMRRSMYLEVPYPLLNVDRYRSEHIDLWNVLSYRGAISAHSLKFYAKRFGFGTLDKVGGADIGTLVAADTTESWQAIHDHVLSDVGLTHALGMRLGLVPKTAAVAA